MTAGQRLARALELERQVQRLEVDLRFLQLAVVGEVAAGKDAVIAHEMAEREVQALITRLEDPERYVDAVDDAIAWLRRLSGVAEAPAVARV
jgi:hypothetical protein